MEYPTPALAKTHISPGMPCSLAFKPSLCKQLTPRSLNGHKFYPSTYRESYICTYIDTKTKKRILEKSCVTPSVDFSFTYLKTITKTNNNNKYHFYSICNSRLMLMLNVKVISTYTIN